jgi:alpha-galactosidase/6-phospho-beta-glucosidase family protein
VQAAVTRDPVTARKALLTHPLVGQDEIAGALLESLLEQSPVTGARA